MATFDRQFRKAFDTVLARERERARVMKAAGFNTYRDAKNEAGDSLMLNELASDCHSAVSAYKHLESLCGQVAASLEKEAWELERTADVLP